jgi:ribokinase
MGRLPHVGYGKEGCRLLLVAGSLTIDRLYRCAELPEAGGSAMGAATIHVGGLGGVSALAAQRSGAKVGIAAAVGDDVDGKVLRVILARSGLDSYLSATKGAPTGSSATLIDDSGRHWRVDALAANALFEYGPDIERLLGKTKLLLCHCDTNSRSLYKLMSKAKERGIGTILHASPPRPEILKTLAPLADLIVTGIDGFSELVGLFHPSGLGDFTGEQIHALSDARLDGLCRATVESDLVIMMGVRGVFVSERDGSHKLVNDARHAVNPSVCCAREVFVGALGARLLEGEALKSAVRYAMVASAMTGPAGGQDAIPGKADVLKELAANQ